MLMFQQITPMELNQKKQIDYQVLTHTIGEKLQNYYLQYFKNFQLNSDIEPPFNYFNCQTANIPQWYRDYKNLEYSEIHDDTEHNRVCELVNLYGKICGKLNKFDQKIQNSLIVQLNYPGYLRSSIQTLKKAMQTTQLPETTINFIVRYAQNHQFEEGPSKLRKLCIEFDKVDKFQFISQNKLLQKLETDSDNIQNSVWTRQQIVQCFVLYSLIKCEQMILNYHNSNENPKLDQLNSDHIKLCTYDYSWSENCLGNIRDFHPQLAKKMNKRYQEVRNLNTYDKEMSKAIFNYTQSLLGYYHHHYSYSQMCLTQEFREKIKSIVNGIKVECDQGLVIIVANAIMFVQVLYALK